MRRWARGPHSTTLAHQLETGVAGPDALEVLASDGGPETSVARGVEILDLFDDPGAQGVVDATGIGVAGFHQEEAFVHIFVE